ncbi:hypothetical protein RKD20_001326 [Streptomyces sp. SLBN-8D4]|jgi:hypothetical protein
MIRAVTASVAAGAASLIATPGESTEATEAASGCPMGSPNVLTLT